MTRSTSQQSAELTTRPTLKTSKSIAAETRRFLNIASVCATTSLSKSKIYDLIAAGRFPRSIPIEGNRVAWIADEVNAWADERIAKARGGR